MLYVCIQYLRIKKLLFLLKELLFTSVSKILALRSFLLSRECLNYRVPRLFYISFYLEADYQDILSNSGTPDQDNHNA